MVSSPTTIFPRIKIVRMRDCIAHEGVVTRWVEQIAANLLAEGVLKNPIIVTRPRGHRQKPRQRPVRARRQCGGTSDQRPYIVIDGMHRFAAFQRLEIPDIVAYEIDYDDAAITLEGWDALVLRPFKAIPFLHRTATTLGGGYLVQRVPDLAAAQALLDTRHAVIAATDQRGRWHVIARRGTITVEALVKASEVVDRALDAADYRPVYVADALALADFHTTRAHGLIVRPHYTKPEILRRTLARRIFPRKSTRHLIPNRPLRVDVGLALLRARLSLAAKNRLLDEHLRWCYESDRVRYYPESVFIFAD